jgi:hypothetical protein
MPESVAVTFEPPPAMANRTPEEYVRLVRDMVASVESNATERRRATDVPVLGPRRILAQAWEARPGDAEPRRQLSPNIACRDKWLRIERLRTNRLFQSLYRQAFTVFRTGGDVIFPFGTWLMRFRASVQVSTA